MLSRDATALNWRERGLMQLLLPPEDVPAVRELVGRSAEEFLDAASGDRIDVVRDLFRPIALRVCEEYFGYRDVDPATLARWVRDIVKDCYANPAHDAVLHAASVGAGAQMMHYLRSELARRRASGTPRGDVFGRLLALPVPAECGIDDERIAVNVAGLPLGFVESAPAAMALATRQLFERPDVLADATRAARDPDPARFDPYVWEALRLDTFFRLMPPRLCEQDYLLAAGTPRATVVTAGSIVLPALASAMYDDDVVPGPEEFRLDRPGHHHLHFGTGHHHDCLGVHVARAVVPEAVRRLLRRGARPIVAAEIELDAIFPDSFPLRLADPAGAGR
jgi:cytochrome P450